MSRAVSLSGAALSACVCLALSWPASAEDRAVAIVEHWLEQGSGHDWLSVSHGGVTHDELSGETTISDLVVAIRLSDLPAGDSDGDDAEFDIDYVFAMPTIVFTDLSDTDTHYGAGAIRAETIEIEFEIAGEAASSGSGVYRGLNARDISWAKWPEIEDDPDRPISRFYPLVAAIVDVSFESLSFEGLSIATESVDPAFTTIMTYGPGLAGPATNGNIARMSLGAITISGQSPDIGGGAQSFGMSIGAMDAETYNYGDLVRLFDPQRPAGAPMDEYRPVIGSFSARDWIATGAGGGFQMAELRMEDIGARQPAIPVLEHADGLFLTAADGFEPEPEEVVHLIAAAYGTMRLGLMEARGMEFDGDGFRGSLELASTTGLSADGIEAIRYLNLEFGDDADMLVRLGEFSIADVGFPSLRALAGFERASEIGDVDTMLAAMPTLRAVWLSDLLVNIPGLAELAVESTMLEMADHIGPIPTRLRTTLEGFSMPVWMLDEDEREPFEALGYETIEAGYELDLAWQAETESVAMSAGVALVDGGTLSLRAALGGVARDVFEDPSFMPFALPMATLIEAGVEFVDDSLTERVIAMVADQQGVDTTTVRAQALGLLPFVLGALRRPDFMTMVMAAANTFLQAPGTLRIDLKPDSPLPLMDLVETVENDPGMALDLLKPLVSAGE